MPIVALTGVADRDLALRAVKMGTQVYLTKNEVDGHKLDRSLLYAIKRKRIEVTLAEHQSQLIRSERLVAIGEMVIGVAHEIQHPTTMWSVANATVTGSARSEGC